MVIAVPTETLDRTWSPVLDGVRAAELDCLQANLAVVADLHHGRGSHLALGSAPRSAPTLAAGGPPTFEVPLETRLAEAEALLGITVAERRDGLDGPALRELAAGRGALYVVGDAHTMSWAPYYGRKHMEHSFLLTSVDDGCGVADAYHNDTPWGSARPGVWRLSPAEFDAAVPTASAFVLTAGPPPPLDPVAALVAGARAVADRGVVDRYVAAVGEHADTPAGWDRLVLDVWLLARTAGLRASWLTATGAVPADDLDRAAAHAGAWQALASQTYVAMRRAQRGGHLPAGLTDRLRGLLHEDAALAAAQAAPAVRTTVAETLATVLGLDRAAVEGVAVLRDLPNFNSFRLVDVIEHVETRLGVELDPDDLVTADLRDLDSLSGLFRHAVGKP